MKLSNRFLFGIEHKMTPEQVDVLRNTRLLKGDEIRVNGVKYTDYSWVDLLGKEILNVELLRDTPEPLYVAEEPYAVGIKYPDGSIKIEPWYQKKIDDYKELHKDDPPIEYYEGYDEW